MYVCIYIFIYIYKYIYSVEMYRFLIFCRDVQISDIKARGVAS